MPQALQNDVVSVLHIVFDNLAGQPVPPPPGGTTTVTLVDAAGQPSALGSAQVGSPDGTGMDGSKVSVIPVTPPPLGDAYVNFDDTGSTAGTQDDISIHYWITFTADTNAVSAHVDPMTIETFPLPPPAP